jgi:phage-related minor tail protein
MTDSENILGVTDWIDNTNELEQQLEAVKGKLHFSRTMQERQEVLALETQIGDDRKRVAELRSLAYETSVKNKPEIERLKLQTARLITASIELDNESVMLEQALKAKYQELTELRKQIEADKNSV